MVHTVVFGSSVATFKVWPSGNFVITKIVRNGTDVTKSIVTNRYVSGMIRFMLANSELSN